MRALGVGLLLASFAACGADDKPTAPVDPAEDLALNVQDDDSDDDDGRRLHSDNVEAAVIFTHLRARFRLCEGEEGPYAESDHTFLGTSVGDPRLTGRIEVRLHDIFNITEEIGPQRGTVVIRSGGRRKVEGEFNSWGPLEMTQGVIVGRVRDEGVPPEPTEGAGKLIANWRITYHANGGISAQIGGATTDNRLPAGVWSGRCRGRFTEQDIELPPPGPSALTATGTGRSWRAPRP